MVLNRILKAILICGILPRSSAAGSQEPNSRYAPGNAEDEGFLAEEERFLHPRNHRNKCTVKWTDLVAASETITERPSRDYAYPQYSSSILSSSMAMDEAMIDEVTARDIDKDIDYVSPAFVRLVWKDLERTGWAECKGRNSGMKLELTLDNFASFEVEVSLELTVDVDGSRKVVPIRIPRRARTLRPVSSKSFRVPLRLSRTEQRLNQSSGRMWVTAHVTRNGKKQESPHSQVVYFHSTETRTWNVYNRKRLEDTFQGGDYSRELTSSTRRPPKRIQYASTGFSSSSVDDFGLEEDEREIPLPDLTENSPDWLVEARRELDLSGGPQRRKLGPDDLVSNFVSLCFTLPAKVNDQEFGDLGSAESWWAVGLRYGVRKPQTDDYIAEGFLPRGPNTCFQWNVNSDTIAVDFVLESKVGGLGRTLHVVTTDDFDKASAWVGGTLLEEQKEQATVVISDFGAFQTQDLKLVEIDFDDAVSVAHAAVVNGLQRLEFLTKRDDEFEEIRIAPFVGPGGGNWASTDGRIKLTGTQNLVRKFVYEHEVCHIFHFLLHGPRDSLNLPFSASYNDVTEMSPGDDNCPAASNIVGQHALRSLESTGAAYSEGFAHFCATVTLSRYKMSNDDGSAEFKYYKSYPDDGYNFDLVLLLPTAEETGDGWKVNYLHNECGCVGSVGKDSPDPNQVDYPCNKVGTELDWLRFWWAYLQSPEGDKPSLLDVMDLIGEVFVTADPQSAGPEGAFDELLGGPLGQYYSRFCKLGCPFGAGGCDPGFECDI